MVAFPIKFIGHVLIGGQGCKLVLRYNLRFFYKALKPKIYISLLKPNPIFIDINKIIV
jgi:hypothetical protein